VSEDEAIARGVAANGWQAISVTDHPPPFIYTCGLMTTFHEPEIILFGLSPEVAYSILQALVEDIRGGHSFAVPGVYEGVLIKLPIAIRPVDPSQHELYLGYAMGHCRYTSNPGGLVAVQVFWPDEQGLFPFDDGCDAEVSSLQPRLDLAVPGS
jgi:hypothetical protein